MNLTSPSQVKAWCIEHEFHPNKTLGQNFLIDKNILEAIVDAGLDGVGDEEPILEIGPGLGVMTQEILRRGHDVIAIEKDSFLSEGLAERVSSGEFLASGLEGRGELTVVTADALDVISRMSNVESRNLELETLISNLPYQAGTRILLELVQRRELKRMTVLLQTEVAERLAAKEGGRDRSLAGVWAQLDYDVAVVRKVGASCFWPRPEVGSSVARLVRHERNAALTDEERQAFFRISKLAFSQRRKQLKNSLKSEVCSLQLSANGQQSGPSAGDCQLLDANSRLMQRRPEELSVDEWIVLAKGLKDANTQ